MDDADRRGPVTLVLVHGGTFSSVMWDGVVEHLTTPSLAVDLPGRRYKPADLGTVTTADWVRSVVEDVEASVVGDVVLVCHSSGGYVMPGVAAALDGRVRRIVCIAATVPAPGRAPVEFLRPDLRRLALDTRDVVEDQARGRTLGGLRPGEPPIVTTLEIVENGPRLGLEAPGPLFEPMTGEGFPHRVPRTYVRCLRDKVIPPELVETMVSNMGGATVVDIDAGHRVAATAPAELAAIVDSCAAP